MAVVYNKLFTARLMSVGVLNYNMKVPAPEILMDFQMIPGFRYCRGKVYSADVRPDSQDPFHTADHHG